MSADSFQQHRPRAVELAQELQFTQQDGTIRLDAQRMLMMSGPAFCEMRAELIQCLGNDLARGLLKRCGFQAGFRDGHLLSERYPSLGREEQMHLGTLLHAKEGWARVETLPETHVDVAKERLEILARWHDSIEARTHVERFGSGEEAVCWYMIGYASGHLSYLWGRDVIAVELECIAKGAEHCTFRVGVREDMERRFPACGDDYLQLNIPGMLEELRGKVYQQSLRLERLRMAAAARKPEPVEPGFGNMIWESTAMQRAVDLARAVSQVDSTVLINGASGTGKELLARGIHDQSTRASETFHAINCATLTESLQNAELFGYARGAFTGANRDKPGIFEATDKGTLFLDEVGELSMSAQASLLRVLQEGQVVRIGENKVRTVDVRIIAATHRNLDGMIAEGTFRQDLFFRLNVLNIRIPALRERDNDVLLLAHHFVEAFTAKFDKPPVRLSPEVKLMLVRHQWPGNVRELQNAVERAVLLSRPPLIHTTDLPDCLTAQAQTQPAPALEKPAVAKPMDPLEEDRQAILAALRETNFNRNLAAERLGMNRTTLWRKMKKLGI